MKNTISRLLIVTAVIASLAAPASAFVRISRSGPNGVVQAKWDDAILPLRAVADPTNADISSAAALATIVASAEAWEAVPTSYFAVDVVEYTGAAGQLPPALANDGQHSVLFEQTGVNFPTAGVIAFVRSFVNVNDGRTVDADLVFNDLGYFSSITQPPTPAPAGQSLTDLQSVLTHEFGHFFGLDHTSVSGATMVPFASTNGTQRSLELDDRAGISAIFPEPSFGATTGTIRGTVVNGLTGAAIFGAHVEAINIASPSAASSVSGISGELTLRNGRGEFAIYGLPPGNYAVRIVPLDGVQTIASDANIGGVYNGLDTNFEIEFWNGAGESGIGFDDPPGQFQPVAVAAGATATGVDILTNGYPGRVFVQPYGQFESTVTFANNGHYAIRYDLPFAVPYTIKSVQFPSFTFNAQLGLGPAPAVFPSVSLCRLDPATGLPNLAAPLFHMPNYAGSANGMNSIPVDLTITTPGETLFWVMRFPLFTGALANYPFVRMDFSQHDLGFFAATYFVNATGTTGAIQMDRNVVAGLTVQMGTPDATPIAAPPALGANRRVEQAEFTWVAPPDVRADGYPQRNALGSVDLLSRALSIYGTVATGGSGTPVIKVLPNPSSSTLAIWAVQAVDKNGNRSLLSPVTITGMGEDASEPNGRINEATALALPAVARPGSYSPAGDFDYYTFTARTGDVITAQATAVTPTAAQAGNDLDLVMLLYDGAGKLVAFNDDTTGLNPRIVYTVPPPSETSNKATQKFTVLVTDFYGSPFQPAGVSRVVIPPGYTLDVSTAPAP
ncbi:MAG TPA: matrixin family metalloprotease [Thermoanaerobaculia bacterium]|nr:matrixin family metalloprotease [Thermoanaerobaculia bacterium]